MGVVSNGSGQYVGVVSVSCRPLSEGKVLKNRFDDIFASTRYSKALEAIRKLRNDQVGVVMS